MKVALVHYWLTGMGGGERVLEALCRIWPGADIFTHVVERSSLSAELAQKKIHTTFINSLPFAKKHYRHYLPLMPLALEQLDLRGYDLVVSSESGPAKGILTRADAAHVCYCHSPMRYLWDFYQDYLAASGVFTRTLMRPVFHYLRMWDVAAASRVDAFAANSRCVAARIRKHWRREAEVIPPPVDVEAIGQAASERVASALREAHAPFYLFVGRLVEYKRADLAIRACAALKRRLVIVGDGPERSGLEALADRLGAREIIHFAGRADNEALYAWYHAAEALLFPGEEDFGIVPVESLAAGTPVIAYGRGGVRDSIQDGVSGVFFPEQSPQALAKAMTDFESGRASFSRQDIRAAAQRFSEKGFRDAFRAFAEKALCAIQAGEKLV